MKANLITVSILGAALLATTNLTVASDNEQSEISTVMVSPVPVVPYLTPAVRDLQAAEAWKPGDPVREVPRLRTHPGADASSSPGGWDPLLDLQLAVPEASIDAFLTPDLNMGGQGYSGVNPPDTVGDVGLGHYIQAVNSTGGTNVQIYDKSGATIGSAFALDSLGSGNCANGYGDPIVLYDEAADRWLLTEFANTGNALCVYVSQTADPTGSYYSYEFIAANSFPDYPKYAVWADAYYLGTNESSPTVYAYERTAMLAGAPATYQSFNASSLSGFGFQMLTPADIDGGTTPPAGAPGYFLRHRDTEAHGAGTCPNAASSDCLEVFSFHVDFATPANSTFTLTDVIEVTEFDSDLCGLSSFSCIPQPGTGTQLDPLREVTMWRNQYLNFGTHETIVGNLATDVDGTDHAGVRWFELRKTGAGGWTLFQEGTYAPDGNGRWMGSAAMDTAGNFAVGYNVSSSTTSPSLRYAGRLAGDPLNTLPQGEGVFINGSASNSSNRYGDYAAMSLDPADGCTFWFTGEYNDTTNWSTQIAAMKFDVCGTVDFTIGVQPSEAVICSGGLAEAAVDLTAIGGFAETVVLSASGNPTGTTVELSPTSFTPPGSSTMLIYGPAAEGVYPMTVTGTAPSATHDAPFELAVVVGAPSTPVLISPSNMEVDVPLQPTFTWDPVASATGYILHIALDPGFLTVIETANPQTNSYTPAVALDPNTAYFWKVGAANVCDLGQPSDAWWFVTANISCADYVSTDVPQPIPSSGTSGSTASTLDITATGSISDIDVTLVGTHTYMGDLDFDLTSPSATTVRIMDTTACGTDEDFDLTLDDDAAEAFPCPPTGGGTYLPSNPLSGFDSEDLNGTWTLTITDGFTGDSGQLDNWSIFACSTSPSDVPMISTDKDRLAFGLEPDTTRSAFIAVSNTGTTDLVWAIAEDGGWNCDSPTDIPWLTGLGPGGSTTAPSADVAVSMFFDSTGLADGVYEAQLCIDSNDPSQPRVTIELRLESGAIFADGFESGGTGEWDSTTP